MVTVRLLDKRLRSAPAESRDKFSQHAMTGFGVAVAVRLHSMSRNNRRVVGINVKELFECNTGRLWSVDVAQRANNVERQLERSGRWHARNSFVMNAFVVFVLIGCTTNITPFLALVVVTQRRWGNLALD